MHRPVLFDGLITTEKLRLMKTVNWGNIAGAALVAGALGIPYGLWGLTRSLQTADWVSTSGAIIESRIVPVARRGPDEAALKYRYVVAGRPMLGDRIGYMRFSTEAGARRLVDSLPVGAAVLVYYDPANPERSVLQRGGTTTALIVLSVGLALIVGWRLALRQVTPSSSSSPM